MVSELVTNVVKHAGPPLMLVVDCDGEHQQVWVRDGTNGAEELRGPGHGLSLVDLLSDQWVVTPLGDDGKLVWFQLNRQD